MTSKKPAGKETICRIAYRHKPYSQLSNEMLKDKRLSLEALGVLVFILHHPHDWKFDIPWLCRERDLGRDRARRLIAELAGCGYCERVRSRNEDGTLGAYEHVFTDEPHQFSKPEPENPGPGKPGPGKPVTGAPGPGKAVDNNKEDTFTKNENKTPLPPEGASEDLKSDLKSEEKTTELRSKRDLAPKPQHRIKVDSPEGRAWLAHWDGEECYGLIAEAHGSGVIVVVGSRWPPSAGPLPKNNPDGMAAHARL